ncbi:hypothetical protein C8T65DRAFT_97823 [Cerioporus squamosus]|nr:hypothetical protein C8T65DRAFT_97823 [Cerioporus squamosus]
MPSLSCLLVKCKHTRYVSSHPLASVPLPNQMEEALTPTPFSDGDVVDIPAPRLDTFGIETACSKTPAVDALVRMTASRARSGHPIRSLVSNMSGTTQEDLASVSEFVEHQSPAFRDQLRHSACVQDEERLLGSVSPREGHGGLDPGLIKRRKLVGWPIIMIGERA